MRNVYLRLTITDAPGGYGDERAAVGVLCRVTRTYWYRLPESWFDGGTLRPARRRQLVAALYGTGPDDADASSYLILDLRERVLTDVEVPRRPWLDDLAGCYVWTDADELRPAVPADL